MSFASDVKEELSRHVPKARHCQIAQLAAIVLMEGQLSTADGHTALSIRSDNDTVRKLYFTLISKVGNIDLSVLCSGTGEENCPSDDAAREILETLKMYGPGGLKMDVADELLLQQDCCRRAFIRGAFLCGGSVSDPHKAYHFEIVCRTKTLAEQLKKLISSMELDAKITPRKSHYIVYLKEGSQIVTLLGLMGASIAYMDYENVRIVKEMRNDINRQVNCETANISKTVNAAIRQIDDIELIRDTIGIRKLPENLQEIAAARLENPDLPLKDLGQLLDPPVGKSGVNHRLRRISEIAEKIRN